MSGLESLLPDAIELLRALSGPSGIHASLSSTANYRAVFSRDAVMAGVAGLLLEDPIITGGMVRTLEHLRMLQGPEGQIASNFEMRADQLPHVSFGTLAPRIDAATWYLIGIALGARTKVLDAEDFRESARAVVRLLDALEYNGRHLFYVPTGGNWADEYIYDGYILYDQVLRAWGLRLLGVTYEEPAWLRKADQIASTITERYWPADDIGRRFPIAAFSPVRTYEMFDLAACSLLAASGVAPKLGMDALASIAEVFLAHSALPPAFFPVIEEADPDWPALRRYHLHEFRNRPHEYHNGGIWPIWLGWLALAQAQTGRVADLERLRDAVRTQLQNPTAFAFEEYFHGTTGAPGGTARMAYSATGIVFLHLAGSSRQLQLLIP